MVKLKRVQEAGLLADKVYRTLREVIVRNRIKAGTCLNESEICEQLGVSRTPVREAFKVLATEGFLKLTPNRCAVVSKISSTDVEG
jgi:DNA-binding GntR family transcriptional regulator